MWVSSACERPAGTATRAGVVIRTGSRSLGSCRRLTRDENGIDRVARRVMDSDVAEAGVGEHLPGELLAPGGAQPGATFGEGHGQAVQRTDRVKIGASGLLTLSRGRSTPAAPS